MGWESNAVFQVLIIQGSAGSGLFAYSPTPAKGKLVASIAAVPGTDIYGNAYLAGDAAYSAGNDTAMSIGGNALNLFTEPAGANGAGPWTVASNFALDANPATQVIMTGPSKGLNVPGLTTGGLISNGAQATDLVSLINALTVGSILTVQNTATPTSPIVEILAAAAAQFALGIEVTGDTGQRFRVDSDGKVNWGPGNAPTDTSLTRSAAGQLTVGTTLKTSGLIASGSAVDQVILSNGLAGGDVLKVTNTTAAPTSSNFEVFSAAAGDNAIGTRITGDGFSRLRIDTSGPGGRPAILFGTGSAALDTTFQGLGVGVVGAHAGNGIGFAGGATPAAIAGVPLLYGPSAGNNRLHQIDGAALDEPVSTAETDTGTNTVTQVTFNPLTKAYTIPAGGVVGSCYRLRCSGVATWGSTQQALTLGIKVAGADVAQRVITNTAFAASAALEWALDTDVIITGTGAGGTCKVSWQLIMSPSAGNLLTTGNLAAVRRVTGAAINTTVANTVNAEALWAATTGAPTITGDSSTYERLGP